LRGCGVREARAAGVVGDDGLEVTLEDERAIAFELERAAERRDASHRFACERERVAKILCDDRRSTRRPRVIARIRKTREPFQKNFELEEVFFFSLGDESRDELLARRRLLATKTARVAQELLVSIALAGQNTSRRSERRHVQRSFVVAASRPFISRSSAPTFSPRSFAITFSAGSSRRCARSVMSSAIWLVATSAI
jgi:hypothetical protein